jgi:hypothetical protein
MTTLTINLDTLTAPAARRISNFILLTAGAVCDATPAEIDTSVNVDARAVESRPRPPKAPEGGINGDERRTLVDEPETTADGYSVDGAASVIQIHDGVPAFDSLAAQLGTPDGARAFAAEACHVDATPDRDMRGVPFDAAMCARAAAPFYGSGPNEGQWKKKVGVDKSKYDAWYAAELAKLPAQADAEPAAFNMGAMFQPTPTPAAAPTVTTAGEFMRWVSESTVAGALTQAQVDAAWSALGLGYADIMPPTPPEQIAENVQALMGELQ